MLCFGGFVFFFLGRICFIVMGLSFCDLDSSIVEEYIDDFEFE